MNARPPQVMSPFNSALETGVRSLVLLDALYPAKLSLDRLVDFDYLVVHTGDAGGPESLHVPLPLRTGEILVRRGLIETGLRLMQSRKLVTRSVSPTGIYFEASDEAGPYLSALTSDYIRSLTERANWLADKLGGATDEQLSNVTRGLFSQWTTQFQPFELTSGDYL